MLTPFHVGGFENGVAFVELGGNFFKVKRQANLNFLVQRNCLWGAKCWDLISDDDWLFGDA